jgi:hypothetical protein
VWFMMPPCGTFWYVGVLDGPPFRIEQMQSLDRAGAKSHPDDSLAGRRLVGLEPSLEVGEEELIIRAATQSRANTAAVSFATDPGVLRALQPQDVIHVVRTGSADLGMSVLRHDELVVAIGAVTRVSLGPFADAVVSNPTRHPLSPLSYETVSAGGTPFVEVIARGHIARVHAGDTARLRSYVVHAVRCHQRGVPGRCESLAIAHERFCDPQAAVHAAELLARPNAGLQMFGWGPPIRS